MRQAGDIAVIKTQQQPQIILQLLVLRRLSHNMQACVHLHILQIRNVIMQIHHVFVERLFFIVSNLILQVGLGNLRQHQLLQARQIIRLRAAEVHVFVHELFQLLQLVVHSRLCLRRWQMLNQAGSATAFCLNTLAGNSDVIRINIRQISQRQIRVAAAIKAGVLARQPFQAAMRTDMRNSVCLPHIAYPTVEGQILMRRCNVRIVVDFFRVLAKTTRRLHGYENIAVHRSRYQDIAVIFHNRTRRFAPVLHQLLLHLFVHQRKEFSIFCSRQLIGSINLLFRQHAAVVGGIGCQLFDKFLRILRNPIYLIATLAHSSQHATDAFDCI